MKDPGLVAERMEFNALCKKLTGWTHDELTEAFNKVANKEHWKGPIDRVIDEKDKAIVAEAVEFFTATKATFVVEGDRADWPAKYLRVTAPGYRAGPAN